MAHDTRLEDLWFRGAEETKFFWRGNYYHIVRVLRNIYIAI
jgi:hypothetical protein